MEYPADTMHALLRAGADATPVAQQDWYREVLDEPDPERQLRLNARNARVTKLRIAGVLEVIRGAAVLDPDIGALWARIGREFHANQRAIVESIDSKGALKAGLGVDRATDILWSLNHPDVWHLLVGERGWSPADYEEWFADTARAQLLGRHGRSRGSQAGTARR